MRSAVRLAIMVAILTAILPRLTFRANLALAAPPVIGTVEAKGAFRVDNATVRGNATLFEGASIETAEPAAVPSSGAAATVSMELNNGARVSLGAGSKGRFFGDHADAPHTSDRGPHER